MLSPLNNGAPMTGAHEVNWPRSSDCGLSSEGRLLALIVYTQASRRESASADVNLSFEQLSQLRDEVKRAIEQAREAKENEGFWSDLADFFGGDLATLAGAIAAVAAVIATGGAAAAVLAVVASAASFAAQHAEELGIPPELAMGIALAASVAGLACGNGQALFEISPQVATSANRVKVVAQVTSGAAHGIGSASGAVAGQYAGAALDHRATAVSAEGLRASVEEDIDAALAAMDSSLDRQLSATRMTSDVMQSRSDNQSRILENFARAG